MGLLIENEDTADGTVHYIQNIIQGNPEYCIQIPQTTESR
jgi:hypothetical protein